MCLQEDLAFSLFLLSFLWVHASPNRGIRRAREDQSGPASLPVPLGLPNWSPLSALFERRLSGIGLHSHSGRPCIDTRGGGLSRARGRKSSWSELPWEPPRSEPSTREGTSPLAGGVRNTALVVLTLCYVTCSFLGFPNLGVRRAQIGALEGVWGQGDQAGLDKALLCARGWLKSRSSLNSPDAPAPAR